MSLSQYLIIQQIFMGAVMVLGFHLIFESVPRELKGKRIHSASQFLGAAIIVIPIASFIYFFLGLQDDSPNFATALNLSAYCLTATLLSTTYYVLLDQIKNHVLIKTHLAIGLIYPFPLWFAICFGSDFVAKHALIAFYVLFVVMGVLNTITCLYCFKQEMDRSKLGESKYGTRELRLIGRTMNVALCLMVVGMFSPAFFSYPIWLGLVFIGAFVLGFSYIYVCCCIMMKNRIREYFNIDQEALEDDEIFEPANVVVLSYEVKRTIEKQLNAWLTKKEYLQAGVSINDVAKAVCTNRTYLSKYINSEYECSFRTWITMLRIKESKRLLVEYTELPVATIALQSGFSSTESFSHIFTRQEGVSPSKWRDEHAM